MLLPKADGDNERRAKIASLDYKNALHLFPENESGWIPQVGICSALDKTGLDNIWQSIKNYQNTTKVNGFFEQKRQKQADFWLKESIKEQLLTSFHNNVKVKSYIDSIQKDLQKGTISPFKAAKECLRLFGSK